MAGKDLLKDIDYDALEERYDYVLIAAHEKGKKQCFIAAQGEHAQIIRACGVYFGQLMDIEGDDAFSLEDIRELLSQGLLDSKSKDTWGLVMPNIDFNSLDPDQRKEKHNG